MPTSPTANASESDDISQAFYIQVMNRLNAAGIPFLVGGAFALARFTGIERNTKDFDIFVRREDVERTLAALSDETCHTEMTFEHWLAKAICGHDFVDIIFSSGNAVSPVDDEWFEHAPKEHVLGIPALLSPAEEMIWSKAFIMERERYDSADVMHLLLARAESIDWIRLLTRFGPHWRVLFSHLCLFGFIYPSERNRIPEWVMTGLIDRLEKDLLTPPPTQKTCQGTLLSREQYLPDVQRWGLADARHTNASSMTPADVALWTEAINKPHA